MSGLRKGARVRSVGPTIWPHGKIEDGTVQAVQEIACPVGGSGGFHFFVQWDGWSYASGPYFSTDLQII